MTTEDYKLNGTNCSCGKSFTTEYQVNGHYASHFKKAKSTKDYSWLEDLDNLLTEADHSQNGEWTSWEVQSYVSVLHNLIKERLK